MNEIIKLNINAWREDHKAKFPNMVRIWNYDAFDLPIVITKNIKK